MNKIWKDQLKCPIVLGFDLDGVSGVINRDPTSRNLPSLMSMRDYGPLIATPRILDLLERHQIKASFYIPGFIAETNIDLVKTIANSGHEIGHHGYMHEPPATLTELEESNILDQGTEILTNLTGARPVGYRSPSWELSQHSVKLLKEKGFYYDSSLMGNDVPYTVETGIGKLIEIPIHWELDDHPYFNYIPYLKQTNVISNPENVYDAWRSAFEGLYHYERSFVLTMHPWSIGRPGRLLMLDKLITHIKTFSGVQFFTAAELAELYEKSTKNN